VIDAVARADRGDVERALQSAERGARAMARLSLHDRWRILRKAADLMSAHVEEVARLISQATGSTRR
jgi:acyl-CoA reductase-like NAD-dependent aldehyde dehydrogenase